MKWKKCILFCWDYGHGKALLTNLQLNDPLPTLATTRILLLLQYHFFLQENNEGFALQDLRKLRLEVVVVCSFVF